jgi:hypothetical protein
MHAVIRRWLTNTGITLAVIVVAVVAAVVGWEFGRPARHSAPRPTANPAAIALRNAATAMESVTSYRFSGQVTVGIEVLRLAGEFSAPDHLHETLTLAGVAPVERVLIGRVAYQRAGTTWKRAAGAATTSDPRSTFSALAGVTSATASGSVYAFTLTGAGAQALISGSGATTTIAGTVTVQAGRIASVSYGSAAGAGTAVSFTYSGLDTTPPVTAPPGVA